MTKLPNPVDRHVGSRLRSRRVEAGLSQEKLGEALGITFQQIQKYEKGLNRIGASRLQTAASVLSVSVNYFFEGAPQSAPDASPAGFADGSPGATPFVGKQEMDLLLSAFQRIPDAEVRRQILGLVQALGERRITGGAFVMPNVSGKID
jgi:transcriptional regulator with XRE-family HTH domain